MTIHLTRVLGKDETGISSTFLGRIKTLLHSTKNYERPGSLIEIPTVEWTRIPIESDKNCF